MPRSIRDYLQHILDEIDYLNRSVKHVKKDDFLQDETLKRAFVRSIEVIGEAAKQVPDDLRQQYPQLEWRAIVGMRDRLIHGYFGIDYEIVWDVVSNKLKLLAPVIKQILARDDI
jgi:uncharacterized protein with HEPN domain